MFDNMVLERSILDLVTFDDIKISYALGGDLQVIFTIDPSVNASTRDWLGIYQAGWTAFESCLTYHWGIGRHYQNSCRTRCMTFKARDISKAKLNTHYQFVYVSKYLEILGVSQYFQFCAPETPLRGSSSRQAALCTKPNEPNLVSCRVSMSERVDNVYTSCGKCESLFELRQEAKNCRDSSLNLEAKVSNLERSVANLQMAARLTSATQFWNEDAERARFQKFLSDMYNPVKPDGAGEKSDMPSPHSRTTVLRSLVSTIDDIISNAEKVKTEILRLIDTPVLLGTGDENCMIDPNASGIQPIPPVPPLEEVAKSEE